MDRRLILKGLVAGVGLACASAPARAASRPALAVTDLAEGLFVVDQGDANVLVLAGPDGCLLVDSGTAAQAAALHALVRERTGKPVTHVINTHWHLAHTGGNERFRRDGAEIIAHENTRLWMTTDIQSRWNGRSFPPRPRAAWPTRTFYTTDSFEFGGETVECGHLLQAHTDGDIYVHLRRANVLATGGVFTSDRYPVTDPATLGWIGALVSAQERLLKQGDAATRIVPGRGAVRGRDVLDVQHKMLVTVRDRLYKLLRDGRSVEEMLAARPTAEFDGLWGDPEEFIRATSAGMNIHYRQIPGIV